MSATDVLVGTYLAFTAVLALSLGGAGAVLAVVHLLLLLAIGGLVVARRRWPRLEGLHRAYPVLLVPLLYMEIDRLSGLAGGRVYDEWVLSWEHTLFGGVSPAMWLCERLPYLWFSEFLHLCYLAFYFFIPILAYRLWRSGDRELYDRCLFSVMGAYLSSYLCQMLFPVMGPRPLFPPLPDNLHGPCWWLCHYLSGQGAAAAAAFPSGHVTVAVAVTLAAWRWDRTAAKGFWPICLGLCLGTVYGRFHYAVDALAGALLAWLWLRYGPRLYQKLKAGVPGLSAACAAPAVPVPSFPG